MKKILLGFALFLAAAQTQAQESNLQLKGTVADTVAQYVYLQKFHNKMFTTIDSVKVKDGSFSFKTKVKTPELYGLSVNTESSPLYVFLEKEPMPGIEWTFTTMQKLLPTITIEETNKLMKALEPFGLVEFVRSARVAIIKESSGFHEKLKDFEKKQPSEEVIENEYLGKREAVFTM